MPNTDWIVPDTGVERDRTSSPKDWLQPENVRSSDNIRSRSTTDWSSGVSAPTDWQVGENYGFALPVGSLIDGIEFRREGLGSYTGHTWIDRELKLFKAGAEHGTGKTGDTFTNTSDATKDYGSSSDVWGGTWNANDINASNFGTGYCGDISVYTTGASNIQIDAHWCKVHFTLPANVAFGQSGSTAISRDVGENDWANPSNATGVKNRSRAASTGGAPNYFTDYLEVSNFTELSTIPDSAVIDGIRVRIHHMRTFGTKVVDNAIRLMISTGSYTGDDKKDVSTDWGGTSNGFPVGQWATYGGSSDDWTTPPTVAQLKASTFGVAIQANSLPAGGTAATAAVDAVEVTVWYTPGGPTYAEHPPNIFYPATLDMASLMDGDGGANGALIGQLALLGVGQ